MTTEIQIDAAFSDDELADIKRCLALLYATPAGTMPGNRAFGIDRSALGRPPDVARNLLTAEIIKKTALFEPRVSVSRVDWTADANGQLIAKVVLTSG